MVEIGGCGRVMNGNSYQVAGRLSSTAVASLVALAGDSEPALAK